jgi:Tol biopolymer transport system component
MKMFRAAVLAVSALAACGGSAATAGAPRSAAPPARVVSSTARLYVLGLRSGVARAVRGAGGYFLMSTPRVSPNGRLVAFGGQRCPRCGVRLMLAPTAGGKARPLLSRASEPAWAPSGRRLAFVRVTGGRRSNGLPLYLVDRNGAHLRKLDVDVEKDEREEAHELQLFHNPTFAPGGNALAFELEVEEEQQVFVLNLKTHVARQLTEHSRGATQPSFSPDGREIVYACARKSGSHDICAIKLDGSDARTIVSTPGDDSYPTVSPDGRRVVFSSNAAERKNGFRSLYSVARRGGRPHRLTRGYDAAEPAFAPSGRSIFFVRRSFVRA